LGNYKKKENNVSEVQQQQMDGHQQMAAKIHSVFAQGQGVQISSAQAEQVVEMKLWLAAVANGQLRVLDTAQAGTPPPVPSVELPGEPDDAPPN
jgi:hypothetical protein